ncbi:MAG: UPF0280 family protein [Caldicoprobacterales bacterium]|jgi:ApbE superfamily uncharacterized protein (UPF0280 family)|nr:UPF0280 family protein [Clostridiales bacterium]
MKQERFYRKFHGSKDLVHFNVVVEQTDLNIGAYKMLTQESIKLIKKYRQHIKDYIREVPEFLTSLKPLPCPVHALSIIKDMCQAAQKCGVGPMAAVAGAIAQYVGQDLSKLSREIIVENGGDIYIKSNKERIIGVYAGDSPLSGKIGIRIKPEDCPLGVCTSSGKIGHSLSFGRADAVVIISKSAVLADAAATAIGNMVKKVEDIQRGVNTAKNIEGVSGVLVIMEDKLGAWGNIELVKLNN